MIQTLLDISTSCKQKSTWYSLFQISEYPVKICSYDIIFLDVTTSCKHKERKISQWTVHLLLKNVDHCTSTVHYYQAVSIKLVCLASSCWWYIIIIPCVTLTYISLLNLMGMLERAILRSFFATMISNGAFMSGSSKQGKTCRALPEDSLVAANHLPSNKNQNVYCTRLQLPTAMLWRIQFF